MLVLSSMVFAAYMKRGLAMSRKSVLLVAAILGALSTGSVAQSLQPRLIGGSVEPIITDTCYVNRGYVTYERDFRAPPIAGTKSVISLPELFVGTRRGNVGWDISGQAVMTFKTKDSGDINFIHTNLDGVFSGYTEGKLGGDGRAEVEFLLKTERGNCTLPIRIRLQHSVN